MAKTNDKGQSVTLVGWHGADGRLVCGGVSFEADKLAAQKDADRQKYKWDKKNPDNPCTGFKIMEIDVPASA